MEARQKQHERQPPPLRSTLPREHASLLALQPMVLKGNTLGPTSSGIMIIKCLSVLLTVCHPGVSSTIVAVLIWYAPEQAWNKPRTSPEQPQNNSRCCIKLYRLLAGWLTGWLASWLVGWLAGWPAFWNVVQHKALVHQGCNFCLDYFVLLRWDMLLCVTSMCHSESASWPVQK